MTSENWQAMVLAAGYGKRLFPLTQWMPKPLVPLTREPILFHLFSKLKKAGIRKTVINTHHLGRQIKSFVESYHDPDMGPLHICHEEELLNTGGGLKNAANHLKKTPFFLVHNSDILSDMDLNLLMRKHQESGALVTLAVREAGANNILIGANGHLLDCRGLLNRAGDGSTRHVTYLGVAAYSAAFLENLPEGPSDLVDTWVDLISRQPGSIQTIDMERGYWNDLGTFDAFFDAQRVIIDSDMLPLSDSAKALVEQGSNRRYYRLGRGTNSLVLMLCEKGDEDFDRFIETSQFLNDLQLGNPKVWAYSQERGAALLEDLGDDTLYRVFHSRDPQVRRRHLYSRVVNFLAAFQEKTTRVRSRCPMSCDRTLDYEHLRWETQYFCSRFLIDHLGFPETVSQDLESEFHALAHMVSNHPEVVIHRDFQSQNILFKQGDVHIVDYQGMRLGSIWYDLASLLNDPYVELDGALKKRLYKEFLELKGAEFEDDSETRKAFLAACLQRNMQALGAYGYLSNQLGKLAFRAFMLPGCRILLKTLEEWNTLEGDKPFRVLTGVVHEALQKVRIWAESLES